MAQNVALDAFRPGDRIRHSHGLGVVIETGRGTDLYAVRVKLDNDPMPLDTRDVFLQPVSIASFNACRYCRNLHVGSEGSCL